MEGGIAPTASILSIFLTLDYFSWVSKHDECLSFLNPIFFSHCCSLLDKRPLKSCFSICYIFTIDGPFLPPPISYFMLQCQIGPSPWQTMRIWRPYLKWSVYHIWCCCFCLDNFLFKNSGFPGDYSWTCTNNITALPLTVPALNLRDHVSSSLSWSIFMASTIAYLLMTPDPASSPNLPLDLHTCVSNCPFVRNTTWMSYRHLKCNMLRTELVIFSLSRSLFASSLSHLMSQLSNQSCKLGILFDSSHAFIPQIKPTDYAL